MALLAAVNADIVVLQVADRRFGARQSVLPAVIAAHSPYYPITFDTGHPVRLPPVIYDPRLVADAIVFAACKQRRSVSISGTGVLGAALAQHFSRLTDVVLGLFGEALQTFDTPPPADRADNLWEPRARSIDSRQKVYVRAHSMWLDAQLKRWPNGLMDGGRRD